MTRPRRGARRADWYIQRRPRRAAASDHGAWVVFKILAVCFAFATRAQRLRRRQHVPGWNVANVLRENFDIAETASAVVVSVLVALVIIGGIRRIGHVASTPCRACACSTCSGPSMSSPSTIRKFPITWR
ncbi:MAG: alanine:cation symporter family protein [Phycisphaerales bacterium]|nr:alanine:cation symporter family protein [Phycisphaerales bacterium]